MLLENYLTCQDSHAKHIKVNIFKLNSMHKLGISTDSY